MIQIDKKNYELRYSLKRLEMIETALGGSVMDILVKTNGALGLRHVQTFYAYGLYGEDDVYCPVQKGMDEAEKALTDPERGYQHMVMAVVTAIQRDCPFLFPSA